VMFVLLMSSFDEPASREELTCSKGGGSCCATFRRGDGKACAEDCKHGPGGDQWASIAVLNCKIKGEQTKKNFARKAHEAEGKVNVGGRNEFANHVKGRGKKGGGRSGEGAPKKWAFCQRGFLVLTGKEMRGTFLKVEVPETRE